MKQETTGTVLDSAEVPANNFSEFVSPRCSGTLAIVVGEAGNSVRGINRLVGSPPQYRKSGGQTVKSNPTRRLRGFLIDIREDSARVGFVDSMGKVTEYILPEKQLRKAGITATNQPFEMDEIEQPVNDGFLTGYVFRPMAPAEEVVTDAFDSDDYLNDLRDAALRHFGRKAGN